MLLFSTLFPSSVRPGHGAFVHTRLSRLVAGGQVEAQVVAPVPWFPSTHPRFGAWALTARTPHCETWGGVRVHHPRYALPPRIGETVAPGLMALGALSTLKRLRREGFDFDLIDAHYYYPDGVAAALLGRWLDRPVVITARGSDLNVLGTHALPRAMMRWAGRRAAASIGVARALAQVLRGWELPPERVHVVRNGVDLERFRPVPRAEARAALGLEGDPLLLSVGNLVAVKGHDLTLEAVALLARERPGVRLVLVGEGQERAALAARASALGIAERVRFAGRVPNEELAAWYSAADASILASRSEGWANVLLESMASGTPVVATDVGGSSEVIGAGAGGVLVQRRDAAALAQAVVRLVAEPRDRAAVRGYAEGFGWDAVSAAQMEIFQQALVARHEGRAAAAIRGAGT